MSARITVTDEMIEKGRKALTFGIMGCGQCCGDNPPDELDHLDFDVARAHVAARAALEAAAPLIAAQALRDAADERDRLVAHAERMAAALDLVLHDAHPIFGSTTKWYGGIGGQAITSHCSITQGAPPGDEWADYDMPSKPLREFLAEHPFDLEAAKTEMKQELLRDLDGSGGGQP